MAIKLNTSQNESREELVKRKNLRTSKYFKYTMFGVIAITILIFAIQIVRVVGKSVEVKKNKAFLDGYQQEYAALKEKYGVDESGSDDKESEASGDASSDASGEASGEAVVIDQFYNAINAGEAVARLQTQYTVKGMLLDDDTNTLATYLGMNISDNSESGGTVDLSWIKSEVENRMSVEWVFETKYDVDVGSQNKTNININDCVWVCYHTAPSGMKYPLMIVTGTYNVNNNSFTNLEKYMTEFGGMYINNGRIEKTRKELEKTDKDVQDTIDMSKILSHGNGSNTQNLDFTESTTESNTTEVNSAIENVTNTTGGDE